jgi:Putative MetA-pathway of phenol degradation
MIVTRVWRIGVAVSLAIGACIFTSTRVSAADACPDASQDIATDRPSVTNSSLVVPLGSLQDENGINWTTRPQGQGALDAPNTRLRLGVAYCTEFLVDMPDYNWGIRGSAPYGFSDVAPAFKRQFEALPEGTTASTIVGLGLPTGTHRVSGTGLHPYIQFPWSQAIAEGWGANGMISAYWFTDQPAGNSTMQATFDIDRQIGEHADVFAEYAGEFPTHGVPNQIFNFGGSYRITKTQQIDFHAGLGLTGNSPNYFVGIGYSLRFDGLW